MSNQGNSTEYLHRRIARDFPEVIKNDQIGEGKKYATPYIAAKALGIVKRSPSLDLKEVENAIKLTDLEQYSDCLVEELSGGEVQRAFIALALAQKAEILLLDEPTTFLDIQFQIEILDLIKKIKKERSIAVISVIHDINLASRYSDKVGLIAKGRMLQLEKPEKILDKKTIKNTFSIDVETISSS